MNFQEFINRWKCQKFRFRTSRDAMSLCLQRNAKNLVETGCVRKPKNKGHARSTVLYADFIDKMMPDGHLWTVDIEAANMAKAEEYTKHLNAGRITYTVGDSVQFLQQFDQRIDFLYLDSKGWLGRDDLGLDATRHQIAELEACWDQIHQNTVILLDDNLRGYGRTILTVPFLREKGFDVYSQGHQVLLVHVESEFSPDIETIRREAKCDPCQMIFGTDKECNWHKKADWSNPKYT